MSLAAHTNVVGNYSLTKSIVWEHRDYKPSQKWGGSPWSETQMSTQPVAFSAKPATYRNDPLHKSRNSSYSRTVAKVVKDDPRTIQTRTSNHAASEQRYLDTYISQSVRREHGFRDYLPGTPDRENAINDSIVEAYAKLSSPNKVSLGASLGEAKQTLGMLAQYVIPLAKALAAAKRGDIGRARYHLGLRGDSRFNRRAISNRWFEYWYGWKPLINDIYSTQELYLEALKGPIEDLVAYGHGSFDNSTEFDYGGSRQSFRWNGKARTMLQAKIENPTWFYLNQLGVINPASVAWELVPFSFLVDWFVPIGAVLETYTATFGLRPNGGYSSSVMTNKASITGLEGSGDWEHPQSGAFRRTTSRGEFAYEQFSFWRTAYTTWPGVGLYANIQPFKSLTRCGHAIALVNNLL